MPLKDFHMGLTQTSALIVEDDPQAESLERSLLEEKFYVVTSASSGENAIALVAELVPDLILLDSGLPGIGGFTTCKVIRKFSQEPIIMLTGCVSFSDKVFGMETGADDYITKPFNLDEYLARTSKVLRRCGNSNMRYQQPEALAENSRKYVAQPSRKQDEGNRHALRDNPRWQSTQQACGRLGKRFSREIRAIKRDLGRDARIVSNNILGRDFPPFDPSCSAWRYYLNNGMTFTEAVIRILASDCWCQLLRLFSWLNIQFEKAKSNRLVHNVLPGATKLVGSVRG